MMESIFFLFSDMTNKVYQRTIPATSRKDWKGLLRCLEVLLPLRLLPLCMALLLPAWLQAQSDLKFKRFSLDQGLSMNDIRTIAQDSKGFVWIGTLDGLNRYDGYNFHVYKNIPKQENSLSNNIIWALLNDSKGNLYIGTDNGGLNVYDPAKDSFTHYKHNAKDDASIGANEVSALFEDSKGVLWVGTDGGGLHIFDRESKSFTRYQHNPNDSNSLKSNVVKAIAEDKQGNLWIGTDVGISVLDTTRKQFSHFEHTAGDSKSLGSNYVIKIFVDSEDKKWIGTVNGLYLFHDRTQSFIPYLHDERNLNSILGNYVPDIYESVQDNQIWIATNFGISVLNKNTNIFTHYQNDINNPQSLVDNGLNTFYWDRMGNIWVGSYAGLCMKEAGKGKFMHFTNDPNDTQSLKTKETSRLYEDKRGNIWVGGRDGFDRFDRNSSTFIHHQPLPDTDLVKEVFTFYEDSQSNFWLGSPTGLYRYDRKKGTIEETFKESNPGAADNTLIQEVWYIQEDLQQNLWICSLNKGVFRLDQKSKILHPLRWEGKYIPNKDIFNFYIDKQGTFWIGTALEGLFKINKEKGIYEVFQKKDNDPGSISSNFIINAFEDSKGNFWIGTRGGLNLMDRSTNTFTSYTDVDGLPNSVINSILEDNAGNLWLGTFKGLSKFDPAAKTFKNYTVDDGLQHSDFWHRSAAKLSSGEMLFGGMNGFNLFHPDSLRDNPLVPNVYLTGFQIFNKPVEIGVEGSPLQDHISESKEVVLSYKQSVFSFDFVALNYVISKNNKYAYKLEGFDKDWNYVGTQRKATYTNIDPGEYTLRVKGSNNDGVWNEAGTSLKLIITPPFWQTWWFRSLAAFAAITFGVVVFGARMRVIKAQKAKLEKQVKEKTADLQKAYEDLTERQEEIMQQQEEMEAQADLLQQINGSLQQSQIEIAEQRDHLKIVNEQVMSSIQYAQTIQKAILPSQQKIAQVFPGHFMLYRPKDVVSGDFYWFAHLPKEESKLPVDLSFMAVVDCTGHGVPGAFMSIIGSTLLNEIVNQKQILDPAEILEHLDKGVKLALEKTEGINTAGMDVCLCRFERGDGNQMHVAFAGAKRDLLFVRKGGAAMEKLMADRRSIGSQTAVPFTTQEVILESGSMLYLATDGYSDQNDPEREKIGCVRFQELVLEAVSLPLDAQQQLFESTLDKHQQDSEQRDDITVIGLCLPDLLPAVAAQYPEQDALNFPQ